MSKSRLSALQRKPTTCWRPVTSTMLRSAVAHRNRYHPVMKVIAELIKDGRIGRVLEIRGRGKGDRRGGGEDLWVLGSHVLNMITYLGGKPRSCSAMLLQDGRRVTKDDVREGAEGLGPLAGNELHARFLLERRCDRLL